MGHGFAEFPSETLYGYPVPSHFQADAATALATTQRRPLEGPLALYIHVPFCRTLCHFCGFTRTNRFRPSDIATSVDLTLRELDLWLDRLDLHATPVDAIFFGGGTASMLSLDQVERLVQGLHDRVAIASGAEWSFEGECQTLGAEGYVEGLSELGFERVSFGVQTLEPGARRVLNLIPTATELADLSRRARSCFETVCADFIYGWPGQTPDAAVSDLRAMLATLDVTSIDLFQFEKLDANPVFMRHLYDAGLTDPDTPTLQQTRRALLEVLETNGLVERSYTYFHRGPLSDRVSYSQCYYGFDQANVLGVGRGAQSFVGGLMWGNALPADAWRQSVLDGELPVASFGTYGPCERELVQWPRKGRVPRRLVKRHGWSGLARLLDDLVAQELLERTQTHYALTESGRDWVPALLPALMPRAQRGHYQRETQRYETLLQEAPP